MEHFASSPEVPSSMASFESNATPAPPPGDWRAARTSVGDVTAPDTVQPQAQPTAASASAGAASCSHAGLTAPTETRRQAFRRAIAQRWTATRIDGAGDRRAQTSFDSIETDGDISDTSCRPEMTTTSFDSTTTTTTTTTDNTDDVDYGVQASRSQHDSGYRSVEVHTSLPH